MRNFLIIIFTCLSFSVFSQSNMGSIKVQNMGNFYRLSVNTFPKQFYPFPDSVSIRITVICQQTMTYEINYLPKNGYVDYQLGSYNYVGISVFRWRKINGIYYKYGQSDIPTVCIFGLNPLQCFQKQ